MKETNSSKHFKKSGLESKWSSQATVLYLSPGEAHILNTSMNHEWLTNRTDIEHILLIDTRSILVFHLNMSRGIAYYILYE